jgi:hypothetical protein
MVRVAKDGDAGYRTIEFTVTLRCNDSVNIERRLARRTTTGNGDSCCHGVLRVVARDSATGGAISGANVRINVSGSNTSTSGTTNGDGVTIFRNLCAGTYVVHIGREGTPAYRTIEYTVTLGCNDSVSSERRLGRTQTTNGDSCCHGILRVVVRDSATGAPLASTSVRLTLSNGTTITATTNGDGVAILRNLCRGTYGLRVAREGTTYRVSETSVGIECNDSVSVERRLGRTTPETCCNASFRFAVKGSTRNDGGWLSGVTIVITKAGAPFATGTTSSTGVYERGEICGNATYTITFSKSGFRSKTITITLTDCRAVNETIGLSPQG